MRRCAILLLFLLSFIALAGVNAADDRNSIDGIWETEGYGMVFEIDGGRVAVYQTTSISGIKTLDGTYSNNKVQLGSNAVFQYNYRIESSELILENPNYGYIYRARRLNALPRTCLHGGTQVANDPELNFEIFWRTFNEHYAFFQLRRVNWEHQYRIYRSQVTRHTTPRQLYDIMCKMVEPLHDGHVTIDGLYSQECSKIIEQIGSEALTDLEGIVKKLGLQDQRVQDRLSGFSPEERNVIELLQDDCLSVGEVGLQYRNGVNLVQSKQMMGSFKQQDGIIPLGAEGYLTYQLPDTNKNIGRITVFAMGGYSDSGELDAEAQAIDKVIEALYGCKAIIIDMRFNMGGSDAISRLLAGRFADRKRLAYSKQVRDGNTFTTLRNFYVEPQGALQYRGKVIVLTGPNTVSAGEIFVMCMKVLPNVTVIGERTNGAHSDVLERLLPNGWLFSLSNERYFAADNQVYEKVGLQPDIQVTFDLDEFLKGYDRVLDTAKEYANQQPGGILTCVDIKSH